MDEKYLLTNVADFATLLLTMAHHTKRLTLSGYYRTGRGNGLRLAKLLHVAPSTLSNWAAGRRRIPLERALDIERITKGKLKVEQLRQDIQLGTFIAWRKRRRKA